jgi:hypothetical protein
MKTGAAAASKYDVLKIAWSVVKVTESDFIIASGLVGKTSRSCNVATFSPLFGIEAVGVVVK